jgi:hypothetical protein
VEAEANLPAVAALIGDPARSAMLAALQDGRALPVRLAGVDVPHALEALAVIAPPASVRSLRGAAVGEALAEARTCYDHLAGRLGVALCAGLLHTNAAHAGGEHGLG